MLFGCGFGNATSLPPLIAQMEFAEEDTPRAVSLIVASAQAAYAFAPAMFGVIRDFAPAMGLTADGGVGVFVGAAAFQTLAIAAFYAGRGERRRGVAATRAAIG